MRMFYEAVEAVLENNKLNGASWKDWDDADHILDTYGISAEQSESESSFTDLILNRLIEDNGENLEFYLAIAQCIQYGQVFSGNK